MLTCWTWDNQITNISSKVSDGLRMLYLARKLTGNEETLKTIYYSLVMLYGVSARGVSAPKHVLTNWKVAKQSSTRIITWADYSIRSWIIRCTKLARVFASKEERGKRHLLVTMFQLFDNNCPTYLRETLVSGFVESMKFTTVISVIWGVLTMITNYRYLKRFFSRVHSLIGVQLFGTNCQIEDLTSFKLAIS